MLLIALAVLVGCSSDEFVGDTGSPNGEAGSGNAAISFGFDVPQVTRASGADAAKDLNYQFIVYGEKNEIGTGEGANVSTAAGASGRDGHLVFKNYVVNYTSNSAYTTTSNTKDWEYVAQTPYSANVTPATGETTQTIKYWDYGASNYVFTAISANNADIAAGRVSIEKTTFGSTVFDKGYTITLAKTSGSPNVYPSLDKIYLSDRLVISSTDAGTNREAVNKYGGNVTLTFRNLLSQVRAGVYETIPGYDIRSIKFYKTSDVEAKVGETSAFGAICPNVKIEGGFEGSLTVTYYDNNGTVENQAKVAVSGNSGSAADLILGTNMSTLSTELLLGKTAVAPTWDTANGDYTNVLPQSVDNTTNLQLKCDYTLWNSVTGETIEVKGATAVIPSQYLQWKSNFKYTYLFKISDNTNGQTGTGTTPAGLYPITFDAVEMVNGDGKAEYITTVSEPSITTFGVKNDKYIVEKNEYVAGSDIYVTVVDGSVVVCPILGTNINVYKATTVNATSDPITEASVAESIAEVSAGAKKITVENINVDAVTNFTSAPAIATAVPKEDGTTITSIKCVLTSQPSDWVASSDNVYYSDAACETRVTTDYVNGTYYKKNFALKLTGVKATTETTALVLEYVKTANTYNTTSEAHTFADTDALTTWMSSNYQLYTDADGTSPATTASGTEVTYYKRTSLKTKGTYAYKVIRVQVAE